MPNKVIITVSMVVLLTIMVVIAIMGTQAPTAAVTYTIGPEEAEAIKLCEEAGKTPWISSENSQTSIQCE